MTTRIEAKHTALAALTGQQGNTTELEHLWLDSVITTPSGERIREKWVTYLGELGYTGVYTERLFQFLGDLGYEGTLDERLYQYWVNGGGGGGGPQLLLKFSAAVVDPNTGEFLLQGVGQGTPTSVNSGVLLPGYDGIYYQTEVNGPAVYGARQVKNLMPFPNLDSTFWGSGASSATITKGLSDPLGGNNAASVELVASVGVNGFSITHTNAVTCFGGEDYVASWWIRRIAGNGPIQMQVGRNFQRVDITADVTSEWTRVEGTVTAPSTGLGTTAIKLNDIGDIVEVANPMLELGTVASEYTPTVKYFATTPSGDPITPAPALYSAAEATNLLRYSNDLTQWTILSGDSVSISQDLPGLDGTPNQGWSVTRAGNQNSGISFNGNESIRTIRYFFLKSASVSENCRVYCDTNANIRFNTVTGALIEDSAPSGYAIIDRGPFWEVLVQNDAPTGAVTAQVEPNRTGNGVGGSDGNDTVGILQVEGYDAAITQIAGRAPIFTSVTSVTQPENNHQWDKANISDDFGAWYAETERFADDSASNSWHLGTSSSAGDQILFRNGGQWRCRPGSLASVNAPQSAGQRLGSGCVWDKAATSVGIKVEGGAGWSESLSATDIAWGGGIIASGATRAVTDAPFLITNIQAYEAPYEQGKAKMDELVEDALVIG
ncbi:MAG: hypothetical protein HRT76_14700 [Halieaceae bacterium]|nr:hypothetical protein [Halieaceae bacterium]